LNKNHTRNSTGKQSFLGGAAVLALATAIVKIIGAFYKIPLQRIIGEEGYGFFSTAYDIYSVLLMISTTGLPVAMSRMISEAQALGQRSQIRKIFTVSQRVFLLLGAVGTVGMAAFCVQLATLSGQRDAWFAVLSLSPAVLFICITSSYRGFFQGQGNMRPTSASQVMEACCKLVVGLAASYAIMRYFRASGQTATDEGLTIAHSWASGGAILGVTFGCVVAALYLFFKHRSADRELRDLGGPVKSTRETVRQLLAIAIPITIGAAGLQMISLIDSVVYMFRLKTAAGFTQHEANNLKGIYTFCQTIFNLPCAFISPIIVSVIPALTEHITMKNKRGERIVTESSIRVMSLIAMPCAAGLAVLSGQIYRLLASSDNMEKSLQTAAPVLAILGVCVLFNSLVLVTNAIMQAHGNVVIPVINMLIGGAVKVVVNYILVGNPRLNIVGAAIGTLICYITITILNLTAMHRKNYRLSLPRTMLKPLLAALLMGAVAFFAYRGIAHLTPSGSLATIGAVAIAGLVYLVLVYVMKIITKEDCELLPKGDKIARILRIH
jgi:stage V sporulation protein B